MTDIELIKQLKWVEDAVKLRSLTVTTKPGILKTELTHYAVHRGDEIFYGKKLRKPMIIPLPSYSIRVGKTSFSLRLKDKPTLRINSYRVILFPTAMRGGKYSTYKAPCLGNYYEKLYRQASDSLERVKIAAEYLQSAVPDFGGTGRRSVFAYGLGLIGDEIIQPAITQ